MKALVILAAVAALCVPAAALADTPPPTATDIAAQSCKLQLAQLGATFKTTYGNYGKCVSKSMQAARADVQNAAKTCKAERADATFAAGHDGKTFGQVYGSATSKGNGAGANAYGKCVSAKAKASLQQQAQAIVTAAKQCKANWAADKAAFAAKYGSKASAFGACVSQSTKSS